jgi:hypothetical protein
MRHCLNEQAAGAKRELAEEILRLFGTLRFAATGCSMLPTILPGDTLVIERANPGTFRVGDIALVGRDGRLCAHRVMSLPGAGSGFWVTQGDAMLRPDRPVLASELLGQVTEFMRAGKNITVSKKLSVIERALALILRRSEFAARVFVYITSRRRTSEEASLACEA